MDETLTAAIVPEVSGHEAPQIDVISSRYLASITSYMSSGGDSGSEPGNEPPSNWESEMSYSKMRTSLANHFGFDSSTCSAIAILHKKIRRIYSGSSTRSKLRASYTFFRLLGGLVYGKDDNDENSWDIWAATAGFVFDDVYSSGIPGAPTSQELAYFVNTLLLDEQTFRRLRYKIRIQNFLCNHARDDSTIATCNQEFKTTYQNAMNDTSVTDDEFDAIWSDQVSTMTHMPDFAHFCITVATGLAKAMRDEYGNSNSYGATANAYIHVAYSAAELYVGNIDSLRTYLAGWLGDTVIGDSLHTPTMGDDDYWSDIDSVYVTQYLPGYGYETLTVLSKCYYAHSSTFVRRGLFTSCCMSAESAAIVIALCLAQTEYTISQILSIVSGTLIIPGLNPQLYGAAATFLTRLTGASEGSYG